MADYDQQKIKKSFAQVYGSAGEAPKIIGLLKAFWPGPTFTVCPLIILSTSKDPSLQTNCSMPFSLTIAANSVPLTLATDTGVCMRKDLVLLSLLILYLLQSESKLTDCPGKMFFAIATVSITLL